MESINEPNYIHYKNKRSGLAGRKDEGIEVFGEIPKETVLYNTSEYWERNAARHIKYEAKNKMPLFENVPKTLSFFAQYWMRETNGLFFHMQTKNREIYLETDFEKQEFIEDSKDKDEFLYNLQILTDDHYQEANDYIQTALDPDTTWKIEELAANAGHGFLKDSASVRTSNELKGSLVEILRKNSIISLASIERCL